MVGQPIEHGGGHLGVAEDLRPIGDPRLAALQPTLAVCLSSRIAPVSSTSPVAIRMTWTALPITSAVSFGLVVPWACLVYF